MRRVDFMVGAREFKELKAEQFMQDAVYCYDANTTCEQLTREMTAGGFGSVPIVDEERRVVGLVTEFDLLKAIMEEKSLSAVKAGDIMVRNPLTVTPETVAPELIRLLEEYQHIRLPVVNAEGKLLGIVARRDILEGYVKATTHRKGFWP
ncbi:MAG: histidine kinase [Nitrospirae bacterium CG_4_9_14_3_um_filter_51_5]|nr:MAG: histidine kinase [Nitrospirae bacterium CG_4_9_14_3_um_filter_51_5]